MKYIIGYMLHEYDDSGAMKNSVVKIKKAIKELCLSNVNLNEFYLHYNLHERVKKTKKTTEITLLCKHCINWLYTVRCECRSGGIRYIEIILKAIKDTMKRPLNDMQFVFTKIIFDTFIQQRNLYK